MIPVTSPYVAGNRLLDALSPPEGSPLTAAVEVVSLVRGQATAQSGVAFSHIMFPIDAVISVLCEFKNGDVSEVGAVGREGFVPVHAVAGSTISERTSICQVPGRAGRMRYVDFRNLMRSSHEFATLTRQYVDARLFAVEQIAACNRRHHIAERCAFWLLMMRDRVGRDEFPLTHELLAVMLGVRRAGVSEAIAVLKAGGSVAAVRGTIHIVNPALLRAASCECYEATLRTFEAALLRQEPGLVA